MITEKVSNLIVTVIIDDTPSGNLQSEHGLALWINYRGKRILFDTGQSNLLLKNAEILDCDLSDADAIVLSHGHYDHTGGLSAVLDIAEKAKIYLHPAAIEPKFSKKVSGAKSIGMSDLTRKAIQSRDVIWTTTPTQLFPGIAVTGQVPRISNFEDTGGAFFLDENCRNPDELLDDQAMFFETSKGLVVILGCAHSGVINTLDYVTKVTAQKRVYAVMGGMHLLNATPERIEHTIEMLRQYDVQKIGLAHCTGSEAVKKFKSAFPEECFMCAAGKRIDF